MQSSHVQRDIKGSLGKPASRLMRTGTVLLQIGMAAIQATLHNFGSTITCTAFVVKLLDNVDNVRMQLDLPMLMVLVCKWLLVCTPKTLELL